MPLILALVLLVLAGSARGMTSGEFDTYWIGGAINGQGRSTTIVHPRLLVNAAQLALAQTNATIPGTLNAAAKARMETFWNSKHSSSTNAAEYSVIIGNVFLDAAKITTWAPECTTYVGRMVSGRTIAPTHGPYECNWTGGELKGNNPGFGLYSQTAACYDLTYSYLNGKRKGSAIRALSKAMLGSRVEDSGGAWWQWTNYHLNLLSIYGDSANASFNATLKTDILAAINDWEDGAAPCWEALDVVGYSEQYYAARHGSRLFAVAMMKSCFPGYDSPLYHVEAITEAGRFYRMMSRTDLLTAGGGNAIPMHRGPDKFNVTGWCPIVTLSLQDALFDDKDSWILANYWGRSDYGLGPNNTSGITSAWTCALWNDPLKYTSSIALADIQSKHMWSPAWGLFAARSAWNNQGAANADIQVQHWPFYAEGAGHLNALHWQMNVGADGVFNNAGVYANADLEDEYQAWLSQSISKNTIGILQSGETTFDGASTFVVGDKGMAAGCATLPTDPFLASGYQIRGDATQGLALFGGACNNPGQGRPQMYKRGENIQSCIVEGGPYYIASDMSLAYNSPKQDFTRRGWYYDGTNVVIVLDQVQVGPNVKMVTSAYHTVGTYGTTVPATLNFAPFHQTGTIVPLTLNGVPAPSATDSIRVDSNGGLFGDSRGGGYRINGNTLNETSAAAVKNPVGSSVGWMIPLEVRNASTDTNGYLLTIGGPGKGGLHWRTNRYPCVVNLFSANRWDESRECWVWDADDVGNGWNAAPSSHATGSSCPTLSCAQGITRFKMSANTSDWSANVNTRNNDASGHGKDTGDWSTYTVVPTPGDADLCESFVVCIGTSSTASKPTVKYTHTGEIVAVAVDQGAGYTVHVVPTASAGPRATTITWDNPLTSENAGYKLVGAEPGFAFDLSDEEGTVIRALTADDQGYLAWTEDTDGVTTFTLSPHDPHILYPPPTPPPDPAPYTLAHDVLYHPRERTLLQAAGGTLLALYYGQGAYGVPIYAQLSRDAGQTWRDLDGYQDSATELVIDEEPSGPNFYTPRGDRGFSAALDPTSNDLWIVTPANRLNGSHTEIAALVRVKLFAWDGLTWSTTSSYTLNSTEVALAKPPGDCVALVSSFHQLYAAWRGPSGASRYSVQSVRIKSGSATSLADGVARASALHYPQLVESAGKIWQISAVRGNATDDSVWVRSATDGASAAWSSSSFLGVYAGGNGEFGAVAGPSGPWWAIRGVVTGDARYAYGYWTGSAWVTGTAPIEPSPGTDLAVTRAGLNRVVLTTRNGTSLRRAYWSLADGWSAWATAWTATGLAYPHVVSLRPTDLLAFGAVSSGLASQPFSIPPESEPTGACCAVQDGGPCTITTQSGCAGVYQGDYTECESDPCNANHTGACCYPDGTCVVTTLLGCTGAGNAYQGDDTVCSPNPCPSGPPSNSGRRRRVILAARE